MKTIEIKLYKFSELSEEAKQKAIEKHYDINVDYDWWQNTYEDARQIGLKITSFDLDRNRHAKGEFLLSACEVAQNILNEHGESCQTYKTAQSFMEDWQPVFNDYMNEESENYESRELEGEMQEMEDDFLKSLCEDYSIMLQNEYEYLYSDEAIIETIEANDYDFTENGKAM
jgi:myo-inositol catabolism protein IolC